MVRGDKETGRCVLIYKHAFLAPSETFVADHIRSLRRWRPVPVCEVETPNDHSLPVGVERVKFGIPLMRRQEDRLLVEHGIAPRLARIARRHGAGLIHAHFLNDAARLLPFAMRSAIPMVATAHGLDALGTDDFHATHESGRLMIARRQQMGQVLKAIFCVSEHIRDALIDRGFPAEKLIVRRLGVNTGAIRPLNDPSRRTGIVFAGRLVEKKGVMLLARAWQGLPPQLREQGLEIIGDGPQAGELHAMLGDDPHVLLRGSQPRAEVLEAMQRRRVLAFPSLRAANGDGEGLPIVLMEALSSAIAPVVFDQSPMTEAVSDGVNGLLARPGDIASYRDALAQLLSDDGMWARFTSNGRRIATQRFDLAANMARLEDDYDRLAGAF